MELQINNSVSIIIYNRPVKYSFKEVFLKRFYFMLYLVMVSSLVTRAEGQSDVMCYTTDPINEEELCRADAELCFEVATTEDNNPENCIYLRGCIQRQILFPSKDAITYLTKEENRNGLFQVCAENKCNKKRQSCVQNYKNMLEEESNKVANLTLQRDVLLKKIDSMNETTADENGNTKATGINGPAIGFGIGFFALLIFVIILYCKKAMEKQGNNQDKEDMGGNLLPPTSGTTKLGTSSNEDGTLSSERSKLKDGDVEVGNLKETTSVTTDEGRLSSKRSAVNKGHNTGSSAGKVTK